MIIMEKELKLFSSASADSSGSLSENLMGFVLKVREEGERWKNWTYETGFVYFVAGEQARTP